MLKINPRMLTLNREVLVADLRSAHGGAIASDDASCTGPCSGGRMPDLKRKRALFQRRDCAVRPLGQR